MTASSWMPWPRRLLPWRTGGFAFAILVALSACTTTPEQQWLGIQPEMAGYVPARMAVLDCQPWPASAGFKRRLLSNVPDAEVTKLCAAIDKFVIAGFTDQPYMRGFSPRFVRRLLTEANQAQMLAEPMTLWAQAEQRCADCLHGPSYYTAAIEPHTPWRLWLNRISPIVRNVDAVLVPVVMGAQERRFDERGVDVAERRLSVSILLIETASGQLIWGMERESAAADRHLPTDGPAEFPDWSLVTSRVLTEDLWREFPGRQSP